MQTPRNPAPGRSNVTGDDASGHSAEGEVRQGEAIATRLKRRIRREHLVITVAAAAAVATVAGGLALTAIPASATATVPVSSIASTSLVAATSAANPGSRLCGPVLLVLKHDYDRVPDALRKDVSSAQHQSSTSAKHEALQNVLKKAQSGGYGSAVQSAAKDKKTLAGFKAAWDRLPSSLRSDLKNAKAASGANRESDLKTIASKAESGGYGDRVKDAIGKVKTRLDKCISRVGGATSTPSAPSAGTPSTSTPSPSTPKPTPTPTTGA